MKSSNDLKKSKLYEDLFRCLKDKFGFTEKSNNYHIIVCSENESKEDAKRRYFRETGHFIDEQDLVWFIELVSPHPKDTPRGSLTE